MSLRFRIISVCFIGLSVFFYWILLFDDSETGTAVLGGYRDRWFLLGLFFTWACLLAISVIVSRSKRIWFGFVAVSIGVFTPIGLMEACAAFGLIDFRSLQISVNPQPQADIDPRLRKVMQPNQSFGGQTVGDLTAILGAPTELVKYNFKTDSMGLRNPREKLNPRVVLLGDSVLVAGLVSSPEILTERLEREMAVEVLNVSNVGYAPQEALALYETTKISPGGRLIVQFIFEGNDLTDSENWRNWRTSGNTSKYPDSGLLKTILSLLHRPRKTAGASRHGTFSTTQGEEVEVYFLYDGAKIQKLLGAFGPMSKDLSVAHMKLRRQGSKTALVFVPTKLSVLGPYITWQTQTKLSNSALWSNDFGAVVRKFAQAQNIPFINFTEPLRKAAARGVLPYFATDTHFNAQGLEEITMILKPWLAKLLSENQ